MLIQDCGLVEKPDGSEATIPKGSVFPTDPHAEPTGYGQFLKSTLKALKRKDCLSSEVFQRSGIGGGLQANLCGKSCLPLLCQMAPSQH